MKIHSIRWVLIFIIALMPVSLVADIIDGDYQYYDLDLMLETFKPSRKGDVNITLFRKLMFEADMVDMPYKRKTGYVKKLFNDFANLNEIALEYGMTVQSKKGAAVTLYVLDELVSHIDTQLQAGDQVTFYAYHAYNSDYGPGLVVHAFQQSVPPSVWQRLKQWFEKV